MSAMPIDATEIAGRRRAVSKAGCTRPRGSHHQCPVKVCEGRRASNNRSSALGASSWWLSHLFSLNSSIMINTAPIPKAILRAMNRRVFRVSSGDPLLRFIKPTRNIPPRVTTTMNAEVHKMGSLT